MTSNWLNGNLDVPRCMLLTQYVFRCSYCLFDCFWLYWDRQLNYGGIYDFAGEEAAGVGVSE